MTGGVLVKSKKTVIEVSMKVDILVSLSLIFTMGLIAYGCQRSPEVPKRLHPGDHSFAIKVGSLERKYTVHVPPSYDGREPVPVVIMFHGGGGKASAAMEETGWSEKADQEGFLAVFPEATPPDLSKPSSFRTNPQTWNDGSGRFHSGQLDIDDVGFVNAMIDDLLTRLAIDQQRIFATGFSNGASMVFRAGVELSHRIAAIAPVSGHLWLKTLELTRPVPLIYIFGLADPLNPFEGGEVPGVGRRPPIAASPLKWAELLGCSLERKVIYDQNGVKGVIYAPCRRNSEVVFYTVEGLGHTWPGGRSLLPESLVGKTSDKLKANDVIWEFFKKHPMKQ